MSDTKQLFRDATAQIAARVAAVPDDRWDSQSPCPDWRAKDVVAHVTGTLGMATERFGGTKPEPTGDAKADFAAVRAAAESAIETCDLSAEIDMPWGKDTIGSIAEIFTADMLIHSWDLARAAGLDDQLPEPLVGEVYETMKPRDEFMRAPGVIGPKVDVADDADLQTRTLAFFGRRA